MPTTVKVPVYNMETRRRPGLGLRVQRPDPRAAHRHRRRRARQQRLRPVLHDQRTSRARNLGGRRADLLGRACRPGARRRARRREHRRPIRSSACRPSAPACRPDADGRRRDASETVTQAATPRRRQRSATSVPFDPSISVAPGTTQADEPTSAAVTLHVPQSSDAATLATAHLKDAVGDAARGHDDQPGRGERPRGLRGRQFARARTTRSRARPHRRSAR